ncbi:macrolide efflux protein A [Kitasatospora sp. Ki12]|uniref:MFS transporter n=1 Tax=Kitasatospora xanthocidica TaxID=83382 RepID=UPI0016760AC4|nr:MFS transporter [Kitasatospora xanthocidica]GHF75630.1 MFS transporter [Kitasatospora xanthocidica]
MKSDGSLTTEARPDGEEERPGLGRQFTTLWTAASSSSIGEGVSMAAAPLMASTFTDDPRLIAGVSMALTLPYALFGIPAGVLVDRVDRRRTMVRIDLFRGCLITGFVLSVALGFGSLWALYACFFLIGTCETFFRNAAQILVPSVVPEKHLVAANGRIMGSETVGNQFVGPLIGSSLFLLAPAVPFGVNAATFFASAFLLTRLRLPQGDHRPRPAAGRPRLITDMATGLRWLFANRLLRTLSFTAGAINLVYTGALAVLVVYAHRELGLSDLGYGGLVACQAVGAISAAKLSPSLVRRIGNGWALVSVVTAIGCSNLVIWLVPRVWAVGAALALGACASVTWNTVAVVLRQTLVPKDLQGRVNSIYRLFAWGALPLGAGLAGVVSKSHGTPAVYALGVGLMAVVAIRLAFGLRTWFPTPAPR